MLSCVIGKESIYSDTIWVQAYNPVCQLLLLVIVAIRRGGRIQPGTIPSGCDTTMNFEENGVVEIAAE